MSAGNHAQALAYHGSRLGIPVSIVMPRHTPNAKVEQTRVFGAEVILHGNQFAETLDFTKRLADDNGYTLIHPFDEEAVIAGQGTLGLEMLEQVPDLDTIIVPVGGGGLIAGTALAAKAQRPQVTVVGVQAERFSAAVDIFNGRAPAPGRPGTVAEGIAVEMPGVKTMAIIRECVDRMVAVPEHDIEAAVFKLLEIEKTVTEGAGGRGARGRDGGPVARRGQDGADAHRRQHRHDDPVVGAAARSRPHQAPGERLSVESPDVPGTLARLTGILGDLDSNIVDVVHQRAFGTSSVRATRNRVRSPDARRRAGRGRYQDAEGSGLRRPVGSLTSPLRRRNALVVSCVDPRGSVELPRECASTIDTRPKGAPGRVKPVR